MKSQTTLEFSIIVSAVVVVAIIFILFYLNYSYTSAKYISISSPNFVQSVYQINSTHIILTVNQNIQSDFMNITFMHKTSTSNTIYNGEYIVLNESKTQTGGYAYILNITGSSTKYNPGDLVCDIKYTTNQNEKIAITDINNC